MPRYAVQRSFPDGLQIPITNGGAEICRVAIENNAQGVTWVNSFVSEDKTNSFPV